MTASPITAGMESHKPLLLRPTESDLFVAEQVFGWQEYKLPELIEATLVNLARAWRNNSIAPIIVDGGANTGYSAIYFAVKFPEAIVIAIEPNAPSFELLIKNTSDFSNIHAIQAALWCDENGVDLEFPDGGAWAVRARSHGVGGKRPRTLSVTLESAMQTVANGRLLICKLDIEGAEREVCRASADTLQAAACVIVEEHDFLYEDGGCLAAVNEALAPSMAPPLELGENLLFINTGAEMQTASSD